MCLYRLVRFMPVALVAGLAGTVANADIVFTENQTGGNNGTISYAGNAQPNPLIGHNLQINGLYCDNCPQNANDVNNVIPVNGILNFTSGLPVPPTKAGNFAFGGNGPGHPGTSFEIDGTIPTLNINTTTQLLTGTFQLAIVDPSTATLGGNFVSITLDVGPDSKDPDILSHFGLPSNTEFSFSARFFAAPFTPGTDDSFSIQPFRGTVTNAIIPEPSFTWLLAASGVAGIAVCRKLRAAA